MASMGATKNEDPEFDELDQTTTDLEAEALQMVNSCPLCCPTPVPATAALVLLVHLSLHCLCTCIFVAHMSACELSASSVRPYRTGSIQEDSPGDSSVATTVMLLLK